MPSDLKRSGFFFNYTIANPEPLDARLVPPQPKRFPKAKLRILAPHNFVPQGVLDSFQRKTSVTVEISSYDTGVELNQRTNAGEAFDIAICSGFMVAMLKKGNHLSEIDWNQLPNARFVGEQFRGLPFDPENKFSVALTWSTIGIAYNTSVFDKPPTSWKDLFEPSADTRAKAGDRIGLLASPHRLFGAALISVGKSPNATDDKSVGEAVIYLRRVAESTKFKFIAFDEAFKFLKTEEVVLAMAQSADVTRIMMSNPNVSFVIPKEGSWVGYDCTAILHRTATVQKEIALEFINYLLHPTVAAEISNYTMKASTEPAARPFLSPVLKHGPSQLRPEGIWTALLVDASSDVQNRIFQEIAPRQTIEPVKK